MNNDELKQPQNEDTTPEKPMPIPAGSNLRFTRLIAWSLTALITVAFIVWLYYPAIQFYTVPESTATEITPTATLWPTHTPTTGPTGTPEITFTPTSQVVSSAYLVEDLTMIDPVEPGVTGSGYILDEDDAATADPDFSNPVWTSSATISTQLGYEIAEPYFATLGAASVTWMMDTQLPAGLYEIFVMDTVFSSAGTLNFRVLNDGADIYPYLGTQQVVFQSMRGTPAQQNDIWHSIGMYNLDHAGVLSVTSSWDTRDENSIVAVDRVMIVPRPSATYNLMSKLPLGKQITVLDNGNATIENASTSALKEDGMVWNGDAEVIINPEDTLRVTWTMQDAIPIGKYSVWVWIPELNGTAQAKYRLMVNGDMIDPVSGTDPGPVVHGGRAEGQWVPVGEWEVGLFYSPSAHLSLVMEAVTGATTGELAVDAVAFILEQ
jgi:hypothetical protein